MNIQHKTGETKGAFFISGDGTARAELTYSRAGDTSIIIDHTGVPDAMRGKSFGKILVEHAVSFARENDLKVIPLCPFAKSVIERDELLQDVLKK